MATCSSPWGFGFPRLLISLLCALGLHFLFIIRIFPFLSQSAKNEHKSSEKATNKHKHRLAALHREHCWHRNLGTERSLDSRTGCSSPQSTQLLLASLPAEAEKQFRGNNSRRHRKQDIAEPEEGSQPKKGGEANRTAQRQVRRLPPPDVDQQKRKRQIGDQKATTQCERGR